jgi:hypothetical protein
MKDCQPPPALYVAFRAESEACRSTASKKDVDGDPYMPYGYPYENDAQYQ